MEEKRGSVGWGEGGLERKVGKGRPDGANEIEEKGRLGVEREETISLVVCRWTVVATRGGGNK